MTALYCKISVQYIQIVTILASVALFFTCSPFSHPPAWDSPFPQFLLHRCNHQLTCRPTNPTFLLCFASLESYQCDSPAVLYTSINGFELS